MLLTKRDRPLLIGLFLIHLAAAWRFFSLDRLIGSAGDSYRFYYPLKYFAKRWLLSGEIPLWNPHIFGGMPFLGNLQSSLFYPPGILFDIFPVHSGMNLFALVHLLGGALAAYLAAARLGFARSGRYGTALIFSLGGFFILQIPAGHIVMFVGMAWLPVAALLMGRWLLWALALCWVVFSGHVQPPILFALCTFLMIFCKKYLPRRILWEMSAGCLGAGLLTAVALVPAFETAMLSTRQEKTYSFATSYSLPPRNLITVVAPRFAGNPLKGNFEDPEHPSFFYELFGLHWGWAALPFLIGSAWRPLAGVALASLALGLGKYTPLYFLLYEYLPGFSSLRVPARFLLILHWIISLAIGVHLARAAKRIRVIASALIALNLCLFAHPFFYTQRREPFLGRSRAIDFLQKNPGRFGHTDDIANPNKAMLYNLENLSGYDALYLKDFARFATLAQGRPSAKTDGILLTNPDTLLMKMAGLRYFISKEPFSKKPLLTDGELKLYSASPMPSVWMARESGSLDFGILKDREVGLHLLPAKGMVVKHPSSGYYAEQPLNRTAQILWQARQGPNRLHSIVLCKKAGRLFFSEIYFPGWRAFVNGKESPIHRANLLFRSLSVEQGANKTLFLFRPASFLWGVFISLAGVAVASLIGLKYALDSASGL